MKCLALLLALVSLSASCRSAAPSQPVVAQPQEHDEPEPFPPPPVVDEKFDWIRLTTNEWLKGELTALRKDKIYFESEELDDLEIDWDKVAEILSSRPFTILKKDYTNVVGVPRFHDDRLLLQTADGDLEIPRDEIEGFEDGEPREPNYWSGWLRWSAAISRGNTDQTDTSLSVYAKRRTTTTRLTMSVDTLLTEIDGDETAKNTTAKAQYDHYMSPRFFLTPIGLEYYTDGFQNIDYRLTPFTGFGYTFLDTADSEWNGNMAVGYRLTRYDSVEAGEDDTDDTSTGILGTTFTSALTSDIDLVTDYSIAIGLEDSSDTNQNASIQLSFDFVWDLDFDVAVTWKRIGQPLPDSGGEVPEKDDLRIDLGFSWNF